MNRRNFIIILTVFLLLLTAAVVAIIARGYRFDIKTVSLAPTGILVATSDPNGAAVYINGKLTTATNNTINLAPGKYSVKITAEGFSPWEKEITIKAEEVFKTSAFLFPNLPDLRPLTLTGAKNPILSPDATKIAYSVSSASGEKNGLWIVDMSRPGLPTGIFSPAADFRQIYQNTSTLDLNTAKLSWSSDNKQIVASTSAGLTYLLDTDRLNPIPTLLSAADYTQTVLSWQQQADTRYQAQTAKINPPLLNLLATTSAKLQFSPDETKILYQATASATLPIILRTYLPGTNPTVQARDTKPGNYYVYDIKEDRNYLISMPQPSAAGRQPASPAGGSLSWFPSSRHLLFFTDKEISIVEFDGTNKSVIYAGPFTNGFVFPWPNWSKIVILTTLNNSAGENLYTINLR